MSRKTIYYLLLFNMTDSHTHLSHTQLATNLDFFLNNFQQNGGESLLNLAYDLESSYTVINQAKQNTTDIKIFTGIGLHPELFMNSPHIPQTYTTYSKLTKVLTQLRKIIRQNIEQIDVIGEIGLDYFQLERLHISKEEKSLYMELQRQAFRQQLELAKIYNLPVSIHTRDLEERDLCIKDTLEILADIGEGSLRGSFHSYTGPSKYINDIIDYGFFIGFNGIITYPNANNVRQNLKETPIEKILLETDAPYLPPQSVRKNKNSLIHFGQPADIKIIGEYAATILGLKCEKLFEITTNNFFKFVT